MNKPKSCRTCKYADWPKSKNGRRLFQRGGKCTYTVTLPMIPQCVDFASLSVERVKDALANRRFIYDGCGKNCECFEKGKP